MKNNDVTQDQFENLADALTENILKTPDGELSREVEEDYGDPRALANKFDQILERAEQQVFGTARSAASPQSSVLISPISLRSKTMRWVEGTFDLRRLSEFLSSLRPRTIAWSATAAALAIYRRSETKALTSVGSSPKFVYSRTIQACPKDLPRGRW